ncbi:MAG: hypothetical protein RJA83_330 [Pseudomonadota bacterium]|jgi:ketosteroid isomerase-like protein
MKFKTLISLILISVLHINYSFAVSSTVAKENFKYSNIKRTASAQKEVFNTIIEYQNALNSADTKKILSLFSTESYSQWNEKLTADTSEKRKDQYDALFKKEKFTTNFAFDTIWINGNTAVVRTHHHKGTVVTDILNNKTILDFNREVFVLEKESGKWKIFLYTFNTNPVQGVS